MSEYLAAALSAIPSTAVFPNLLGLCLGDSPGRMTPPTEGGCCVFVSQGRVGDREGVGDSQGLTWMLLPLLILFCKMTCVHRHVQWFQR